MKAQKFIVRVVMLLSYSLAGVAPAIAEEPANTFIPDVVFAGHSEGDGQSRIFFKPAKSFHVESFGHALPDGTFRLDQSTTYRGEPTTKRFWLIKNIGQNKFAATLSDASGPVDGFVEGARLKFSYRVKGIFVLHQQLELQPDGKTIDNVGKVTLLGIPIGWLRETIVRKD